MSLQERLGWASTGGLTFLAQLQLLPDTSLAAPSPLPGWSMAEVTAHVTSNATALCRLCAWAATGVPTPMYASASARQDEIRDGATLEPVALRSAARRAEDELMATLEGLSTDAWTAPVVTTQGRQVTGAEIPWMRAREVWVHAVDLGAGLSFDDFPAALIDALLNDITRHRSTRWEGPTILVDPVDRGASWQIGPEARTSGVTLTGTAAELCALLTGRAAGGVTATPPPLPELGPWL